MTTEQLTAILLAAMAAPGFWEIIKSLVDKILQKKRVTNEELAESLNEIRKGYDSQQKDIDSLKISIDKMKESENIKDAQAARRRILRFNDELLRSIEHSKEYFDEIVGDVDEYRRYTNSHPDYSNGKANLACENIERVYRQCLEEKTFL